MIKIIQKGFLVILLIEMIVSEQQIIGSRVNSSNVISNINNALMHILRTCGTNYDTLLVSVDPNKTNLNWLHNFHTKFSIIFNKNVTKYSKKIIHLKKIDAHILFVQSTSSLRNILKNSHEMVWWDVMIPVYFLKNECKNYVSALRLMWEYKTLIAFFLCFDLHQRVKIYTYNPFTNRSLSGWKRRKTTKNYKSWTLYERIYRENDGDICEQLDFDRTKWLDGYAITVAAPLSSNVKSLSVGFHNYSSYVEKEGLVETSPKFLDAFVQTMNVTFKLYLFRQQRRNSQMLHSHGGKPIQEDDNSIYRKSSADILLRYYSVSYKRIDSKSKLKFSYPIFYREFGILTLNRGYRTPIEKMYDFYEKWTILFTIFILLITFIVIWHSENKKFIFALMDIIRLLINHSLHTQINSLSLRIFFFFIFIYFIVIQATISGHLAKFLIIPDLREHPESLQDIKRLGYKLYYNTFVNERFLTEANIKKKTTSQLFQLNNNTLTNGLLPKYVTLKELYKSSTDFVQKFITYASDNDSLVACTTNYVALLKYAVKNDKLHVNKKPFGFSTEHFSIRRKWPLTDRVTKFVQRLLELGFTKHWHNKKADYYSRIDKINKAKIYKKYQPVSLENLSFVFIILGIGLATATISFCIEKWIKNRTST